MDSQEMVTQRLLLSNEKLMEAYEALNPGDPKYWDKLKTLSALHEKLVKDIEIQLENERKVDELTIESDRVAVENLRVNEESLTARRREKIDISGQIITVLTTIASVGSGIWMFKRATKKEADEAILSTTDQTVVRSGLSSMFRFGRH